MTSFAIVIHSSPAHSALAFAKAVLAKGHRIEQLFFYRAGVNNSVDNELAEPWRALIATHQLDAYLCSASAAKHGIDVQQAANLQPFHVGGLMQLISASTQAERVITFGDNSRPGD